MNSSGDVTLVVAIAASVIGIGVAFAMWRRRVRLERVSRRTHPSMQPPLALSVVATGDEGAATRRWVVTVRPDAPAISIDIVTSRASGSRQPWSSEPIVAPIRVEPGGSTALPSTFAAAPAYDAVVGWTEHRVDGDVERSRTFQCLDVAARTVGAGTVGAAGAHRGLRRPRLDVVVAVLLLAGLAVAVWGLLGADSDDELATGSEPIASSAAPTTTPATAGPTTTVPSTTVATTAPPTTIGTTTTSAAPTSVPRSTTPPTTTPDAPVVEIRGTIGECRFGSACLIAGFRVVGFDTAAKEYVCEFADGSRVTFGFDGDGVDAACATGSADATITIEVAGVRSDTITRETIQGD